MENNSYLFYIWTILQLLKSYTSFYDHFATKTISILFSMTTLWLKQCNNDLKQWHKTPIVDLVQIERSKVGG